MGEFRSRLGGRVWIALSTTVATLMSAAALAQPLQYFLTIQPIDVCADDGTGCATMNNLDPALNNVGTAGPNVQVGFASNGINITNQIYNLAGINVVFQSTEQYNNSSFQSIQAVASQINPGQFTSPQLELLTQQSGLSQGQTPTSPLSPSPTTLNMFFVDSVLPDASTPGTLFGLSWIGNNGIAIGANSFGNPGRGGQTVNARADTIAHEIGHDLSLDHATFGNDPQAPPDSLTAGATRNLPNVTVTNVTTQSNATWLGQIVPGGSVDQLNPTQLAQIINPYGAVDANGQPILNAFLNPVPGLDAQIVDPVNHDDFSVSFDNAGRTGESLKTLTLTAPIGFQLDPSTFSLLDSTPGVIVTPSFLNCTGNEEDPCQSMLLTFSGSPFVLGDKIDYTIAVCSERGEDSCHRVSPDHLAGGTYQFQFSDGYQTTSFLQSSGVNVLDANSWDPAATIPAGIYDEALFIAANAGRLPCAPFQGMTTCPPLDLADANPAEEGTAVAPEPSSMTIILAALGFWYVLDTRRRRHGITPVDPRGLGGFGSPALDSAST